MKKLMIIAVLLLCSVALFAQTPVAGVAVPTGTYQILCVQNAALTAHTGTVNETVLYTCKLPSLSANSVVRVSFWSKNGTNSGNTRFRVRLGGLSGTAVADPGAGGASANDVRFSVDIRNRNSTNAQLGTPIVTFGSTIMNSSFSTAAVDTSTPQDVVITCVLGAAGDSTTVQFVEVQLAQ